MTKRLVIAEKPSVGMTIAAILGASARKDGYMEGQDYIVSWGFGHLTELANADSYDEKYAKWSYDDLPIVPANWKYKVPKDKYTQFVTLKKLMSRDDVSEVINACDAGREGELIFRNIYKMAKTVTPVLGEKAAHNGNVVYSLDFQVTPHQLRHTYITNLIYASVDPKTVQYLAGHENSKITMDIYAKVKYNKPEQLSAVVNTAFGQPA